MLYCGTLAIANGTHWNERSRSEAQRSDNVIERSERTRFVKEAILSCSLNEVKTKRKERTGQRKGFAMKFIFFRGKRAK